MDKSFDDGASSLWAGNPYLAEVMPVNFSFPLQYFYVAVTEASSSCVCKTAKVNFYQVPTTKTYTGTTTKEDKNHI